MHDNEYRMLVYTLVGYMDDGRELRYVECYGNSDWAKPTSGINGAAICAGSICVEADTGVVSMWDEKTEAWVDQFSFQGSGS